MNFSAKRLRSEQRAVSMLLCRIPVDLLRIILKMYLLVKSLTAYISKEVTKLALLRKVPMLWANQCMKQRPRIYSKLAWIVACSCKTTLLRFKRKVKVLEMKSLSLKQQKKTSQTKGSTQTRIWGIMIVGMKKLRRQLGWRFSRRIPKVLMVNAQYSWINSMSGLTCRFLITIQAQINIPLE